MRADRFVGIADRDRDLEGGIEDLAAVRPAFVRVAPDVKLPRRAADVDRDRFERELGVVGRLGGGSLLGLGRLRRVLRGCIRIQFRFYIGRGGVELRRCVLDREADAAARGDELADDRAHQRLRHAELEAEKD